MTQVTNSKAKMDSTYRELVGSNFELIAFMRAHVEAETLTFEAFADYAREAAGDHVLLKSGREVLEGTNDDLRRIRNNALLSKREAFVRFVELQDKVDYSDPEGAAMKKVDAGQVEALARFYYYSNRAESAKAVLAERNVKTIEVPAELLAQIKELPESEMRDVVTSEIYSMLSEPGELQTTVAEVMGVKRKRKDK